MTLLRSIRTRLEALEKAHGANGLTLAEALRVIRRLRERRGTFATAEEWLAYRNARFAGKRVIPELAEALGEIRQRRGDGATVVDLEAAEREAWRADRGHYLSTHPEEIRTPLDRALAAKALPWPGTTSSGPRTMNTDADGAGNGAPCVLL